MSDGTGSNIPGDATNVLGSSGYSSCAAVKIGNKIYILPLGLTFATGLIYDIDTGIFTKQSSNVQFSNNLNSSSWCIHDNKIYVMSRNSVNHYLYVQVYDPILNKVTTEAQIYTSPYQDETNGMWVSDEYIFLAGGTVYDSHWYDRPVLYDRGTKVATLIANTQNSTIARGTGYVFKHDTKLYFVGYCVLAYSYDLQTGEFEIIYKQLNSLYKPSIGSFSPNTYFYALGKLYLIGGQFGSSTYTFYGKKRDVLVYDLISEQITTLENVISEDAARSFRYFGGIDFQGTLQAGFFGGYVQDSSSSSQVYQNKIMVFNIQTNEFSNGTVVCQPSAKENVTEMYSDKLSTLDFGISEVYYQSADGFSKQPAAIIKNGVVTDIGSVTPEPTPTPLPELTGTWKFNTRIYPPETPFDITSNYSIASEPPSYDGAYTRIYINNNKLMGTATIGATMEFYDFATNTSTSQFGYFRTDSVQNFTDEFRAWLASNATKQ